MPRPLFGSLALALLVSGCGSDNSTPTAPTPPVSTPTRIISITGDLAFGSVALGDAPTRTYTISNTGNAPLTVTSLSAVGGTGSAGFAASFTGGTIAAGASQTGTLRFTPTLPQFYSHVLTVVGDQTSGNAAINVSGTGVNTAPPFTVTGSGANVFTLPPAVARVRVFADYGGNCENFIVHLAGRSLINEILGTCAVATSKNHFDGTFSTPGGGLMEVLNSTGIAWTFVEVR